MAVEFVGMIVLVFGVLIQLTNGKVPETYKMKDNCAETITFSDSMILKSESFQDASCNFDMQADNTANKLMLQVTNIDLIDSCNVTSIEFDDQFGQSISGKLCQAHSGKYTGTNNVLRTNYQSKKPQTPGRKISVLITSFHHSPCFPGEFKCSNSMCVSTSLTCNGYDECSDGSDEGSVCNGSSSNRISDNIGIFLLMCLVSKLVVC